jgi:HAD superfamily hydrolase (TIGR01490 family)
MNLVVFDFCETLVHFQTADRFVDYVLEKEDYKKFKWLRFVNRVLSKLRVIAVVNKLFPEINLSKRLKLFQIRGIENARIVVLAKDFYEQELMTNLISPLYEMLQQHIDQNDYVVIISGGYSPYIKVFLEQHQLNKYFATEIALSNSKVTGFFSGKDCLYAQKVVYLNEFLKSNDIQFSKTIAYSDSISDLPLLQWANEGVVVSRHKPQSWARTYGFKEIVHD